MQSLAPETGNVRLPTVMRQKNCTVKWMEEVELSVCRLGTPGASIPQQPRRYPPTSSFSPPFPFPLSPPFPSFPSPSPPLPAIPFLREAAPLKPVRGLGRCKLPQWGLGFRRRFWCVLISEREKLTRQQLLYGFFVY